MRPPAVKDQRRLRLAPEVLDEADQDEVVAAGIADLVAAFEPGAAAGQQRSAAGADRRRNADEAVFLGLRKRCENSTWSAARMFTA
jgi:hypothetical protein